VKVHFAGGVEAAESEIDRPVIWICELTSTPLT
jgi:hypothetical protein